MKTCTVLGHVAVAPTYENYPVVQLCEDCVQADAELKEDPQIITSA